MMKHRYIFNHDHYYHTLKGQIGEGLPVFHGVRQRGGGLGSVIGSIAKYAIPLIQRYILPHAKSAALSTLADVTSGGQSIKQALKRNGVGFLRNVGGDILSTAKNSNQTGRGLNRGVSRKRRVSTVIKKSTPRKRIKKKSPNKKRTKPAKKKQKKARSRLDIFS